MNSLMKWMLVLSAFSMVILNVMADDRPNIPSSEWEQHPEAGIELAITLNTQMEKDTQKSSVKVYIKNTSPIDKFFLVPGSQDEIQIYYIDSKGTQVPLRNYNKFIMEEESKLKDKGLAFKFGEILIRTIGITPYELVLVQSHPVLCKFKISHQKFGEYNPIESAPRLLVVTPAQK